MVLAALTLGAGGCQVQGEARCEDSGPPCTMGGGGAVVVRWRVADDTSGRLFGRSQCCCSPASLPGGEVRDRCEQAGGSQGTDCPESPAWLIPEVKLQIQRVGSPEAQVRRLCQRCASAELTTAFCLDPGDYDLSLSAPLWRLQSGSWQPAGLATVPAAVRRTVVAGQIVNLDTLVLVVNDPQRPADLGPD